MKKTERVVFILTLSFLAALLYGGHLYASSYHVSFTDGAGRRVVIDEPPSRVVSLVPSVTDIMVALGIRDELKGLTYHDSVAGEKELVGGFLYPSVEKIEALKPDLIFVASIHRDVIERLKDRAAIVELNAHSIEDIYRNIRIVGRIFQKEGEAEKLVKAIKEEIELVAKKLSPIPREKRKRVVRIMGGNGVMVPGDDSFQLDYIRAAGGIPLTTGKSGEVVGITKKEWVEFNPQVIYACNKKSRAMDIIKNEQGWKDVEAVRKGRIFFFPCELTCRGSVNAGYFVSWLASTIYADEFAEKPVLKEGLLSSKPIGVELDYILRARVDHSLVGDFTNKTLVVELKEPMRVLSTLEGWREGVRFVGNHYIPPQNWTLSHRMGLKRFRKKVYRAIGMDERESSFLFTGADMDNLSIVREAYKDLVVYALVTAGVKSNALRASKDTGSFYEPGTINIIILTNARLSARAMSRAVITATEAKTAALQDLDIRSSQSPMRNQATGTGTDNIIVVEGRGVKIESAGGHTKMGELIAHSVYKGVREAIHRQNGIAQGRSVFQRLKERGIELSALLRGEGFDGVDRRRVLSSLEALLMEPEYASFVETALTISDAYEDGLIRELATYRLWCRTMAEKIAGESIETVEPLVSNKDIPVVIRNAFDGILRGLLIRLEK